MRCHSLSSLILLAGTASAALLTLSSFEGLGSPAPVQCLYAYNSPIRGCTPHDFVSDATCSESCIQGLQAVQFTVRSLCANVNTASSPLLKQIQAGNILGALCKADTTQKSTTSASASHTSTTLKTTTKQTSSRPQSTISSASHLTSTKLSTTTEAATSTTTSTTAIPSTTSVEVSSSTSKSTTEATITPTSQTTTSEPATSSSERPSKPTRPPNIQPGSGGGSPFDFVASNTATKFKLSKGSITTVIGIALMALTLI